MAFKIVRNDISKVKADVVVNSANPAPIYAGFGTDASIYGAAGAEQLQKAREEIGFLEPGQVGVTPAFNLKAKYIVHTVGPIWTDGKSGELDTLRRCYKNSLSKAVELKAKSVAFPLISTGVYGFPKDKALKVATEVFEEFLKEQELRLFWWFTIRRPLSFRRNCTRMWRLTLTSIM